MTHFTSRSTESFRWKLRSKTCLDAVGETRIDRKIRSEVKCFVAGVLTVILKALFVNCNRRGDFKVTCRVLVDVQVPKCNNFGFSIPRMTGNSAPLI